MWNRAGLKDNAKENLRRYYWPAFLVCLIVGIFTGEVGNISSNIKAARRGLSGGYEDIQHLIDSFAANPDLGSLYLGLGLASSFLFTFIIIGVVIGLLIGNPLIIGKNRYFMCNRDANKGIGEIGFVFNCGAYWNVVKIKFLMELYIFLWSLLLIIPGIIKSYEYAMVPYILAENPEIESRRAFELSREMMMGEKWNYFVLQISFIGWYLAGLIVCGIGGVFVNPYYEATLAEFYGWARESMFASGFSNRYELKGFGEGA